MALFRSLVSQHGADEQRATQPAIAADKRVRARFALPHTLAAEWHVGRARGEWWADCQPRWGSRPRTLLAIGAAAPEPRSPRLRRSVGADAESWSSASRGGSEHLSDNKGK